MMKKREYIIENSPDGELEAQEYAEFVLNIQKALLFSLEKKNYLTLSQRNQCVSLLEKKCAKR